MADDTPGADQTAAGAGAAGPQAEAGVEEARVMDPELAHQGIVGLHLGGVVFRNGDRLLRGENVEVVRVENQAAPAPRFSRTEASIQGKPPSPGQHTDEALADWGLSADEIAQLREHKAIA